MKYSTNVSHSNIEPIPFYNTLQSHDMAQNSLKVHGLRICFHNAIVSPFPTKTLLVLKFILFGTFPLHLNDILIIKGLLSILLHMNVSAFISTISSSIFAGLKRPKLLQNSFVRNQPLLILGHGISITERPMVKPAGFKAPISDKLVWI